MPAKWNTKMRKVALLHYLKEGRTQKRIIHNKYFPLFLKEFKKAGGEDEKSARSSYYLKIENLIFIDPNPSKKGKGLKNGVLEDVLLFEKYRNSIAELEYELDIDNQIIEDINLRNRHFKKKNEINELIGRKGEEIFFELSSKNFFPEINQVLKQYKKEIIWVNEDEESGLPYDFKIGDNYFIDIKTTTSNNNRFWISNNEWKLFENNKLIFGRLFLNKKYEYEKIEFVEHKYFYTHYKKESDGWIAIKK